MKQFVVRKFYGKFDGGIVFEVWDAESKKQVQTHYTYTGAVKHCKFCNKFGVDGHPVVYKEK